MKLILLAAANSVHTIRWANAFVERGIETHLVSQHAVGAGLSPRVSVHLFPHFRGAGYFLNHGRLRKLVNALRPDLLNAHYATGYGTLADAIHTVPVVLNVWGSDVYEFPDKGPMHRWLLRRNLRHAAHIVSTSKAMAQRTLSICAGLRDITVVPFGVDTSVFQPRVPLALPSTGTIEIGTVKTLSTIYGIDLLIKAFALVVRTVPAAHLRIVGGGPEREQLEQLSRAAGLADRVQFVGAVPHAQVPNELRKLDLFVALSRMESFGVAVLEASACGIPVVVSNVGGLPEVVQAGVSGSIVPQEDVVAAAERIAWIANSPEIRERMGNAGVAFVHAEYEWSRCVDRMITVLENALPQSQKG